MNHNIKLFKPFRAHVHGRRIAFFTRIGLKNSKPIKQLALSFSQATYTPIPYFRGLLLDGLAEWAEMASKKP